MDAIRLVNIDGRSPTKWDCDYGQLAFGELLSCPVRWRGWKGGRLTRRRKFCRTEEASFVDAWRATFVEQCAASVCVYGPGRDFVVAFTSGRGRTPRASRFWIACPDSQWSVYELSLRRLGLGLLQALQCFWGCIYHQDEFDAQHSLITTKERGGVRISHRIVLGVDETHHLPGIYWENHFGPTIVRWIGEDRIRSCPCHEQHKIAPGYYRITAYPNIFAHDLPEALAAKDDIRKHLGEQRFFDRRFMDRTTIAPPLDWSELTIPGPPEDPDLRSKERERACRALRKVGVQVNNVWDLLKATDPYPQAIPVLVRMLDDLRDPRIMEGVVRALTVKEARGQAGKPLVNLFKRLGFEEWTVSLKWAIANALTKAADLKDYEDIVALLRDRRHGKAREMLAITLGNLRDPRGIDVLIEMLEDEEVAGHAVMGLGQLHARKAASAIERFLADPKAWIRREAKRALAKIEKKHG